MSVQSIPPLTPADETDALAWELFVNREGLDLTEAHLVAEALEARLAGYAAAWDSDVAAQQRQKAA